jgi:hypothetical protein
MNNGRDVIWGVTVREDHHFYDTVQFHLNKQQLQEQQQQQQKQKQKKNNNNNILNHK